MNLRWQKLAFARGQLFSLDGAFALLFCALFILVFSFCKTGKEHEINLELLKIQKINDLLITAQHLKIDNMSDLEKNFKKLLPLGCGYIKINNSRKEIECKNTKNKLISNSIKYINNIHHNVYVEIGIY